jgi:hypothetical protein
MTAEGWGIPTIHPDRQAWGLPGPVRKWGSFKRGEHAPTIHFYCDDYRFTRLWFDPSRLVESLPLVVVEPNFSTYAGMSRAEVLWGIYRKRDLARDWQDCGIAILVDLNVDPAFRDLSLLGVPEGWNAYATRVHRGVPFAVVEADHAQAVEHSGRPDPFFVVFGGGHSARVACRDRGWPWIPEHRQVVEGRVEAWDEAAQAAAPGPRAGEPRAQEAEARRPAART